MLARRGVTSITICISEEEAYASTLTTYKPLLPYLPGVVSTIIPGKLYISDWESACNPECLIKAGIRRILCIETSSKSDEILEMYRDNEIEHLQIRLDDVPGADMTAYFDQMIEYIDKDDRPVLVHCKKGISRSVSAVLAYLCSKGFSPTEAVTFVRDNRCCAKPQYGFLLQIVTRDSGTDKPEVLHS